MLTAVGISITNQTIVLITTLDLQRTPWVYKFNRLKRSNQNLRSIITRDESALVIYAG